VDPARLVRNLADRQIRSAEDLWGRRKADIDPNVLDRGIACEDSASDVRRPSSPASRGEATNRMAIRKLIGIPRTKLIRVKRPSSLVLG
jgi:hypothetical protein